MIERIGILGGGQLAQMMTQAAISLGLQTVIFEREADSPASRLTAHQLVGSWNDLDQLAAFADLADIVTLENEFVDSQLLAWLEERGAIVYPSSYTLALVQDKLRQKERLAASGLPVPDFAAVTTPEEVEHWGDIWGWPLVLKARRDGYDGHGNATICEVAAITDAWYGLGGDKGRTLYVERFVHFSAELAVMVARNTRGEVRCYPVVQTEQRDHICHRVFAPAPISDALAAQTTRIAQQAIEAIDGVGIFGVELFLLQGDEPSIVINELAPRPHNSGHYSIEACTTSQFENHLRAIMGLPLGDTSMRAPAAVMINLLGERHGQTGEADDPYGALATPQAHLHLYGKRAVRIGRKMGHITVLANTLDEALSLAQHAAQQTQL